ncbi:MAG: YkgJ family cysteine cluster protein [Candidatus Pacebacteria bacterium]|nr:YkgJ family cysteine cluster protein [Candidatus Paceibacterota bacterium]
MAPGLVFDGKKRRIYFTGKCPDNVDLCEAICCRSWDVPINKQEFRSRKYAALEVCNLPGRICENQEIDCSRRRYKLKKKKDGSCVYLNSQNRCRIYPQRPLTCRLFECKNGWNIANVLPPRQRIKPAIRKALPSLREKSSLKARFMLDPAIKLKNLFCLGGKVTISAELCNENKTFTREVNFPYPEFGRKKLAYLIGVLDGRNTLEETLSGLQKRFKIKLSRNKFLKMIRSLLCLDIIIPIMPIGENARLP